MILRFLGISLTLIIWGAGYAQSAGQTRYSSGQFQYYTGSAWQNMGRGASGSGACSAAGQVRYVSGRIEFCNGSAWQTTDAGVNLGACSTAGQTRYSSGRMEFCNGSQWREMKQASASASCNFNFGSAPHGTTGNYYITNGASSCAQCAVALKNCTCNNGTWACVGGNYMMVYYTCEAIGPPAQICDY